MCAKTWARSRHVDECAAGRAIAEVLDLGPLGFFAIGASVSWDLHHRSELVRYAEADTIHERQPKAPDIVPIGCG
jgi:hypothetical protein